MATSALVLALVTSSCGDERTSRSTERRNVIAAIDRVVAAVDRRDSVNLCRDFFWPSGGTASAGSNTSGQDDYARCVRLAAKELRGVSNYSLKFDTVSVNEASALVYATATFVARGNRKSSNAFFALEKEQGAWHFLFVGGGAAVSVGSETRCTLSRDGLYHCPRERPPTSVAGNVLGDMLGMLGISPDPPGTYPG